MNKALIKVLTLSTLLPMATIVQADMKPYIEGQINYVNPDDIESKNTISGTATGYGNTITATNLGYKLDYDNDFGYGFEIGLKDLQPNVRLGFSFNKVKAELDKIVQTGSLTVNATTYTNQSFSSQEVKSDLGLDFDNDVKTYMANVYYDFNGSDKLKPFVGFGIGLADIENLDDKELALSASLGLKYYFDDNIYLGAKGTYSNINGGKDELGAEYKDINLYTGTLAVGFEF